MRVLFLTWDGPQQTYLESLFLPIFSGLRAQGVEVHVLQLTWARAEKLVPVRAAAQRFGIPYESRHIPNALRKIALPGVVAYGAAQAVRYAKQHDIQVLFPRSLIPMAMALTARRLRPGLELMFDADGFMADERIDFGGWSPKSPAYRALRAVEARGARRARAVICRTAAARQILTERAGLSEQAARKIFVAPNAKDTKLFAPLDAAARARVRARHGVPVGAPWVVYVGSIGPQYCPELMMASFARVLALRPDAHFSCCAFQIEALQRLARQQGLPASALHIEAVTPAEVPAILAACDVGLALRRQSFSQRGICPIKVAEYLLSGTPTVATPVGDLQAQLGGDASALLIDENAPGAAEQVASWFVNQVLPQREPLRGQARALGLRWFDLERCVDTYALAFGHGRPPR